MLLPLKQTEGTAFVATLGALMAVTATSVDIMIPAQPTIARGFGLPDSAGAALVATFAIGYGVGQVLWGPLSDRFGRLPPLFVAMAGFIFAGAVCALTGSFTTLLAARCVQGFMGGAGPTLARAIARDLGGGARTARALSAATAVLGAAPLFAPLTASGILVVAEWRAIFWTLAVFGGVIAVAALLFVPETLPPANRRAPSLRQMAVEARELLVTPSFLYGTAMVMSVYIGYMALLAMGSAVTESAYGLPPTLFGPLFSVNALAFICGAIAAGRLAIRFGISAVIKAGAAIAGAAGLALLALSTTAPGLPLLWTGVVVYVLSFGTLLALCTARALEPAGKIAGTASSVMGVGQTLISASAALMTAGLFDGSHRSLCWVMGAAGVVTFILWVKGRKYL